MSNDGWSMPEHDNGPDPDRFTNPALSSADLPHLDETGFEPVAPSYVRLRLVSVGVAAAVVAVVAGIGLAAAPVAGWLAPAAMVGVLAIGAVAGVMEIIEARRMGYLIRVHDFSIRRGVLWRRVDTIPFARVQHAVIRRGPIERAFGLATLHLLSAGGSVHAVGLDDERAQRLKNLVVERAGALADEELGGDHQPPSSW